MIKNISNQLLQEKLKTIYDYSYTNSTVRTPTSIGKEVGKILHIGMYIEEVEQKKPAFSYSTSELKLLLTGENTSFSNDVGFALQDKYNQMNKKWNIYEDELLLSIKDISYISAQLNNILISDHNRDVFGDALEVFRSKWIKQEGGQFFTDQKVTSLAMHLLNFDPRNGDDIVDLCAGTGGFLLAGLKHIQNTLDHDLEANEHDIIKLAEKSLKGQEIDTEVARIGNATLSSRLGSLKEDIIYSGNSLDQKTINNNPRICFGTHSCAATNPPFGAKIAIKDIEILKQYDLAKISNAQMNKIGNQLYRRAPDVLFIEQNVKLLKPGKGKLAIVLPYQILSGPQMIFVRNWLLKQTQLLAVIDLPSETFQPHTGTKTALILLKRRKQPLVDISNMNNEKIFMSLPRWIGHDRRGNPVYKKNPDGKTTNEILNDFDDVTNSYKAYLNGKDFHKIHEYSFVINSKQILDDDLLRINAQFYANSNNPRSDILDNEIFTKVKIKDVVKKIFFPGRFKRNYVDKYDLAVPFLGGSNITQLIIETDKWFRHDDPKVASLIIREGWLLVTRSGSTGIVSSVPKSWDGVTMSEHVIRIIPDNNKLDAGYIQAFLKTRYCQAEIAKGVFGSVIDEITPESIGEIEILIPKDTKLLHSLITQMKEMEIAKEKAISNLYKTVNQINDLLLSN